VGSRVISSGIHEVVSTGVRVPHEGRIVNGGTKMLGTETITRAKPLQSVSGLTRATNVVRGALTTTHTNAHPVTYSELEAPRVQ
jgi:hypothetical protein